MHHDVRMCRTFGSPRREQQLATHSQVDHHRVTGIKREQQIFSSSIHSFDDSVGEARDQFSSGCPTNDTFTPDFDINNSPTGKMALQSSSNSLDFGKFRH
jgi:hypothetical protein